MGSTKLEQRDVLWFKKKKLSFKIKKKPLNEEGFGNAHVSSDILSDIYIYNCIFLPISYNLSTVKIRPYNALHTSKSQGRNNLTFMKHCARVYYAHFPHQSNFLPWSGSLQHFPYSTYKGFGQRRTKEHGTNMNFICDNFGKNTNIWSYSRFCMILFQ